MYVVSMRVEGEAWEKVKSTKHTKALVTGLKSKKKYKFKVIASNSVMISLANVETEASKAFYTAKGVYMGALNSPWLLGIEIIHAIDKASNTPGFLGDTAEVCIYAATLPLSLLFSPVTVPITAVLCVSEEMELCNVGDLTPVSDNED